MRVFRSLQDLGQPLPAPAVSIGNFDGVHRGHQRILKALVQEARRRRGCAVAITFDPHPTKILTPATAPPLLLTLPQRLALLEAAGVDLALVLPFTPDFSRLSPRAFVKEVVLGGLGAEVVCVGQSFRFGYGQAGDAALLKKLAREFGFTLRTIPPVVHRGKTASSSLIRRLIVQGDVAAAAGLLARPFALTGEIQSGSGRGRTLDFHTLNIVPEQECLPARGVYVTETVLEGRAYASATNVGIRPTFDGGPLIVESHLLDFSRTLRGRRLEVRFYRRLRDEMRFSSPEALRAQIERDVERTRRYFARRRRKQRQGVRK
jgi:riboflavin kinase/FMN adenylyltransferase